mgnify:CR=1 FL=1
METKVDHFAQKSKSWDMNSKRVQNAKGIAELIVNNINKKVLFFYYFFNN